MARTKDAAIGYTKDQFLSSKRWSGTDKDILSALLDDDKTYAPEDAQRIIDQFKKAVK